MNFYTQLWTQFMRVTFLLISISLTVGLVSVKATDIKAQGINTRVDMVVENESLASIIKKLEGKANLVFAFDELYLKLSKKIIKSENFKDQSVEYILATLFAKHDIGFKVQAGNILLFKQASGQLNGRVTDEQGEAMPGASVRVVGTSYGATAKADGSFNLSVPEGTYTVQATFVGYNKAEIKNVKITGNKTTNLNLTLVGGSMLKEVMVSYGKQRSKEVTGSIAQVDASQLQDMPVMQFAQQLQGKAAGVQVVQSSGQPGRGVEFRIRGAASFYASNQPLFVIDGIPITGSINNINPAEIESYSILKDASATSLYGSRAANGVVLITTRHGKPGESSIQFSANYGAQKMPTNRLPKMMDARGFAQFMNEKFADARKYEGSNAATPAEYLNPEQYGEGTNWYNLLTRTAPIQNYSLSIQSAREKSTSSVVAGYQDQQGVLINTGTKLFSLRINQDLMLSNNKLKLGFSLAPSYRLDHNNRLGTDGVGGLFERIFEASPLKEPYNADGSWNRDTYSPGMVAYINPLAQFTLTKDDYKTTRILANAYLNYEFIKGLSLKTNVAVDKGAETRNYFQSGVVTSTVGQITGTSSSADNGSYTAEANLVYNKTFAQDHNVEALVGYSAQKYSGTSNSLTGLGFPNDDIEYLKAATVLSAGSSNYSSYSLLSAIARVNYNYKGRYLLQGAIRRDGSSRFGENQKYGSFPSISAGWVVSDEKFMERFKFLDLFKIRASYGITGNNFFGNYEALATIDKYYYAFNGVSTAGQTINRLQNKDLRWERNKQFDIGFDLTILNNRVNLTYDYYHKVSDGLIMQRPIPKASGFASILDNVGALELWGHEIGISSTNLTGKLKWNTNFNISFDRNIIKELVSPGYIRRNNTVSSDYFRQQQGRRLGEFYGFVFLGLYKDAADLANSAKYGSASDVGTIKVADVSGPNGVPDGVIDDVNDRTFIGDPTPTFTGGLTNNFSYKNWDLNIHMNFSVGNDILNASKWAYQTNMDGSRVMLAAAADRWRSPENPGSGIYPRTKTGTTAMGRQVNSQWVEDGSHLTAKNISLGYRFNFKDRSMLRNLRVYGSVQQAFVITGYTGLNPEINFAGLDPTLGIGVDENAYPIPRTFSIGLSATFK